MDQQVKGSERLKILVMHDGGWIGDMVLLNPSLKALRMQFPNAYISILVRPLVKELMLRNPYVNEVIIHDKSDIRKTLLLIKDLRMEGYDIAIIQHPNSIRSAIIAFLSKIPKRVAIELKLRDIFVNAKVKRARTHEVLRYLNTLKPIVNIQEKIPPEFWGIRDEDRAFARSISRGSWLIGINISTTWTSKQWFPERFAELINGISIKGLPIAITGSKDDIELVCKIMKEVRVPVIDLVGKTTIWQLGAIIESCKLYITCDSGPMHIASALGVPTVALFGPTDPARHGPFGEKVAVLKKDVCTPCYKRYCKYKHKHCMDAIKVEDVIKAVYHLWEVS